MSFKGDLTLHFSFINMYAGEVKMREIVCYLGAGLRAQLYEKTQTKIFLHRLQHSLPGKRFKDAGMLYLYYITTIIQ